MMARVIWITAALAALIPQFSAAQELPALPSGHMPELLEILYDEKPDGVADYMRFRFVDPSLSHETDYAEISKDFETMCRDFALDVIAADGRPVDIVVIAFADRPTEFAVPDPDAAQFFEGFSVKNGDCIWEPF